MPHGWARKNGIRVGSLVISFACAACPAFAGMIEFQPSYQEVLPGEMVSMDVVISSSDHERFHIVNLLFNYDQYVDVDFDAAKSLGHAFVDDSTWAYSRLWLRIWDGREDSPGWQAPLLLGTASIDTSSLAPGTYRVFIDPDWERETTGFLRSFLNARETPNEFEALFGGATLRVVPEPASVGILFAGSLLIWIRQIGRTKRCRGR